MIRTYKSRKETGGGLDHRDILLTVDEKSSAFDAFYIQNIKQVKRELSSVVASSHTSMSSKSRKKKKYVKRLVKEVESPRRESVSSWTFLTPDKSIRVNKGDIFDQLLNSSPQNSANTQSSNGLFDMVKNIGISHVEKKSYSTIKPSQIKKINCSESSGSDSDNEYADIKDTEVLLDKNQHKKHDTSDIRQYQLMVEKNPPLNHKPCDDSITNVITKLPLLKNCDLDSSNSLLDNSYKDVRHRLTSNLQSPISKNSPLSSTPFIQKCRSKSIYRFSPIPLNLEGNPNSSNERTIIEHDEVKEQIEIPSPILQTSIRNKSVPKMKLVEVSERSQSSDNVTSTSSFKENEMMSPIIQCTVSKPKKLQNVSKKKNSSAISCTNMQHSSLEKSRIIPAVGSSIAEATKNILKNETDSTLSTEESTMPSQPFLGFTCNELENGVLIINVDMANKKTEDASDIQNTHEDNSRVEIEKLGFTCNELENGVPIINVGMANKKTEDASDIQNTHEDNSRVEIEKLGFTCNELENAVPIINVDIANKKTKETSDIQNNHEDNSRVENKKVCFTCNELENGVPIINEDMANKKTEDASDVQNTHEYNSRVEIEKLGFTCNELGNGVPIINVDFANKISEEASDKQNTHEDNSRVEIEKGNDDSCTVISTDSDGSMYDTCDSDSIEDIDLHSKIPIIKIEKMKNSIFQQYYAKMDKSFDKISSVENRDEIVINSSNSSIDSINDSAVNLDVVDTSTDEVKSPKIDKNTWEYERYSTSDSDSTPVEDDRCFITTRRRNELLRQTVIFDNSYTSSGSDNNKTVLVNPEYHETDAVCSPNVSIVDNNKDTTIKEVLFTRDNENTLLENQDLCNGSKRPKERNFLNINEDNVNISCRKSRLTKDDINTSISSNMPIVLLPGKKWERSLSIIKRMTILRDRFDTTILDEEDLATKGRNYRQSVMHTMELQDNGSLLHNDSFCSTRSSFAPISTRSTFRLVKEPASFRASIANSTVTELQEFLTEDCDDTVIELSKLSLADDLDLTVIDKVHAAPERVTTSCDYVLRRCNQTDLLPFDECYPDTLLKNCHKIGEGVYGEVFLLRGRDGRARVMKVVPVAGNTVVNGERQKGYQEIIAEIVIAMELSALRAPISDIERHLDAGEDQRTLELTRGSPNATDVFNQVLEVHCVRGLYPARLLELWDLWDETKGSDNDCPGVLPANQQYIVLELAHAGQDLESYVFNSSEQAYGTFIQVAFGLAVGEAGYQLEHRDLHWGNVLVASTQQKYATFVLEGRVYRVPRRGVAATIIDYSLSRLSLQLGEGDESAALYNDLASDDSLFSAYGDYQFEVYRLMRDRLGNDWKKFEPYTNVLWLHYTIDKMVTALRYKRTTTKLHKHYIAKLKDIRERLLDYNSAIDFVHSLEEY